MENAKKENKILVQHYIEVEQKEKLIELAKQDGESVAEHIRRAIDAYLLGK